MQNPQTDLKCARSIFIKITLAVHIFGRLANLVGGSHSKQFIALRYYLLDFSAKRLRGRFLSFYRRAVTTSHLLRVYLFFADRVRTCRVGWS